MEGSIGDCWALRNCSCCLAATEASPGQAKLVIFFLPTAPNTPPPSSLLLFPFNCVCRGGKSKRRAGWDFQSCLIYCTACKAKPLKDTQGHCDGGAPPPSNSLCFFLPRLLAMPSSTPALSVWPYPLALAFGCPALWLHCCRGSVGCLILRQAIASTLTSIFRGLGKCVCCGGGSMVLWHLA